MSLRTAQPPPKSSAVVLALGAGAFGPRGRRAPLGAFEIGRDHHKRSRLSWVPEGSLARCHFRHEMALEPDSGADFVQLELLPGLWRSEESWETTSAEHIEKTGPEVAILKGLGSRLRPNMLRKPGRKLPS